MTREEAIKILKELPNRILGITLPFDTDFDYTYALNMAIKALEQEPCEDCVSKQAVLDLMQIKMGGKELYKAVYDLPPVNPQEPKTGHWILKRISPTKLYGENLKEYECSECYRGIRCTESQLVNYPYCHCGCRMVEQERSDKE